MQLGDEITRERGLCATCGRDRSLLREAGRPGAYCLDCVTAGRYAATYAEEAGACRPDTDTTCSICGSDVDDATAAEHATACQTWAHDFHGGAAGSFWPDCALCPPDDDEMARDFLLNHAARAGDVDEYRLIAGPDLDNPFDEQPSDPPQRLSERYENPDEAAADLAALLRVDALLRNRAAELDAARGDLDTNAARTLAVARDRYLNAADELAGFLAYARCRA